jgi:regulator of cell morphogenesis and NO signaling
VSHFISHDLNHTVYDLNQVYKKKGHLVLPVYTNYMTPKTSDIREDSFVTDIVRVDYRTADVFRKYGIDYCCGGKLSLQKVCELRGLDIQLIKKDLENALRNFEVSNSIDFNSWSVDFLIDFIVNVHHSFLVTNLPEIRETLDRFVIGHKSRYPFLTDLQSTFSRLQEELSEYMNEEETVIFPYIKQIAHAYESQESYAALLVRTLRKPLADRMRLQHAQIRNSLHRLRELTNHYDLPSGACITHTVIFEKLKRLDDDLVQHVHLENNILFPKAMAMENELLGTAT